MAVTKGAPGVTVEVLVNGQALHEYSDGDAQDNVEGPSHSSCYVEAQSGMLFEIRAHVKRGTQHLGDRFSFRVTVDGRYIDKITMFARDCKTKDDSQCNYGRELSSGMVQRYCFADLTTSDEATLSEMPSAAQVKDLGIIRVELHHKQTSKGRGTESISAIATSAFNVVPEKVLKGQSISHSVELKNVQMKTRNPRRTARSVYVDASRKPAATFDFRYRSRASLQSMLLIPRTPSPAPLKERDVNAMFRNELIQLVVQNGLLDTGGDRKKIKSEHPDSSPRRRKARRNDQTTVIELDDNGDVVRETVQAGSVTSELSGPIVID